FARSVDMDNLQACLMEIDRQLDALDATLENKLQRAVTMLGNTYQDGKQVSARIRASVHGAQAAGRLDGASGLDLQRAPRARASREPSGSDERMLHVTLPGR